MDGLIAKRCRFLRLLAGCLVWVACADISGYPVAGTLAGDVPRPANGKAMVVFVRPQSFFTNMQYEVFDGDQLIAAGQPSGRCHLYEAEPGTHMFSAAVVAGTDLGRDARVDPGELSKRRFGLLPADVAEGKFYYVLVRQWNMVDGGFGIEMRPISRRAELDMNKLDEWLTDCKLLELRPEDHEWMEHHREAISATRALYKRGGHFLTPEDGFSDGTRPSP